jgi:hypothetical protein
MSQGAFIALVKQVGHDNQNGGKNSFLKVKYHNNIVLVLNLNNFCLVKVKRSAYICFLRQTQESFLYKH